MKIKSNNALPKRVASGEHVTRCFKLVDVGTQSGFYDGKPTRARKFIAYFELPDSVIVTKIYTASLHPKATLRKDLESWRGQPFADAETDEFDVTWMLDRYCLVNIKQSTHAASRRAAIERIAPLPDDYPRPAAVNPATHFDIENPDLAVFMSLNPGARQMIEASPEWQQQSASTGFRKSPIKSQGLASHG